jgi:baseplate J-like protein
MAISLSDLLIPKTVEQVVAKILAVLQSEQFPVTDWQPGGVERTRTKAFATALSDLVSALVPIVAGGGFVDYARAAWLRLLAKQRYDLDYGEASFTKGTIRLTCAAAAGPYTIVADQLRFQFPSGLRYQNKTGGVLASAGTLNVSVQSEYQNDSLKGLNYVDPSGAVISMVTPLAGVTATNIAPPFSSVSHAGVGGGTVTPSGTAGAQYQITIRIDTNGQAGVAAWSYSINGAAYVSAVGAPSSLLLPGTGITVTLANGPASPSLLQGDTYTFASPGTWISEQGTDEEIDSSLAARCKNRWPSLNALLTSSPTLGYYDLLARQASAQVTQTKIQTDPTINNKVLIVIAGQGGVLPDGVRITVQDYISKRVTLTDYPVVIHPTVRPIVLTGVATVDRSKRSAAQASAEAAVRTYINTIVGINGVVRLAEIIDAVMAVDGMVDLTGLTINGSATNLTLPVTANAYELSSWAESIATALTWVNA